MVTALATKILPYVIPPKQQTEKIGNSIVGVLEVSKYHGLTDDERKFIKENSTEDWKIALQMALSYSKEKGLENINDMANALFRRDFNYFRDDLEKLFKYVDKIEAKKAQETYIYAAAIIIHRVPTEEPWTLEDVHNPELISIGLVNMLAEFAYSEEAGEGSETTETKQIETPQELNTEALEPKETPAAETEAAEEE